METNQKRKFVGLWFPELKKRPHLVVVPLDHALDMFITIDDLHTTEFIRDSSKHEYIQDIDTGRLLLEHDPTTGIRLPYLYVFYYEDQTTPNKRRSRSIPHRDNRIWRGNVLVMRVGGDKCPVDILEDDKHMISHLLLA